MFWCSCEYCIVRCITGNLIEPFIIGDGQYRSLLVIGSDEVSTNSQWRPILPCILTESPHSHKKGHGRGNTHTHTHTHIWTQYWHYTKQYSDPNVNDSEIHQVKRADTARLESERQVNESHFPLLIVWLESVRKIQDLQGEIGTILCHRKWRPADKMLHQHSAWHTALRKCCSQVQCLEASGQAWSLRVVPSYGHNMNSRVSSCPEVRLSPLELCLQKQGPCSGASHSWRSSCVGSSYN